MGNTNGKHSEKRNEFERDEAGEKRRVEWYEGHSEARDIARMKERNTGNEENDFTPRRKNIATRGGRERWKHR